MKDTTYQIALVPIKSCSQDTLFFFQVFEGCLAQAQIAGNVNCDCIDNHRFAIDQQDQADIIKNLTKEGLYDGIALAVHTESDALKSAIFDAVDAGIDIVTFDSDAPNSRRAAFIGTDNASIGKKLAKMLIQVNPVGGKYALVSDISENSRKREENVREALAHTDWFEIEDDSSTIDGTSNGTFAVEKMFQLVEAHSDLRAIISVYPNPMNGSNWKDFANEYRDRINLVNIGSSEFEIDLLRKGYTDALVGKLPHDMGKDIVNTLVELQSIGGVLQSDVVGSHTFEMIRTPSDFPTLDIDYNYIKGFVAVGYICFTIVAILSISSALWTFVNRNSRVVKASQPFFLYILCLGVLVYASTIIALGIDDEHYSLGSCNAACMAVPWLFSLGFALVFSVLFSKTWRVNKIFHNPNRFTRLKVTPRDVILPMMVLLTLNSIILLSWTIISPLKFVRKIDSTDFWKGQISSMGLCERTKKPLFNILSAAVMMATLVMANIQAWKARDIETEFSESKYIAILLLIVLQASLIAMPLNFVQGNNALARYIILTLYIFLVSVAIILLIFVPKYKHHKVWLVERERKLQLKREKEELGIHSSSSSRSCEGGESGLKFMVRQSMVVHPNSVPPWDENPQTDTER